MNENTAVRALAALAQTSRLQVFRKLIEAGPEGCTPTQLSESLDIAPSSLSFHLKELTNAGLLTQERDGRKLIYRPAIEVMNDLVGFLTDNCCRGAPCGLVAAQGCSTC